MLPLPRSFRLSVFLLSTATLAFEITLTRLFSVTQFYHFAFMVISIALLGSGASGTVLAVFPRLGRKNPQASLSILALATGLSLFAAYLLTNALPFDSYSIAWDRRQVAILVLHYIALAIPFFCSGMAVGLLLSVFPNSAGQTYAANLVGSALGCVVALATPVYLNGEGSVVLCSGLAALASLACMQKPDRGKMAMHHAVTLTTAITLLGFVSVVTGRHLLQLPDLPFLKLHLSPYKGLSYALQVPGAEVVFNRWNATSRIDVVRSSGIHSFPGLSYRYLQPLPPTDGLLVDGDDLSPILSLTASLDPISNTPVAFTDFLPAAVAFQLQPGANALILEPRGGLDVFTALSLGVKRLVVVEANPLIVEAAGYPGGDPRVQVTLDAGRSYLRRTQDQFDLIMLSLTSSFHPVRSGAYSLVEDYRYTVESFQDILTRLAPGGLFVVTRWLQDPPSEDLRTFALAVTTLESRGFDPREQIVAFRGYNTITLLVKTGRFAPQELEMIHAFIARCAFDLVYAPDIRAEETNLYNIYPESIYYKTYIEFLNASPRQAFYAAYPYEITPPTDDHPFFGHYFKWSQVRQVLADLGRTWQPFGGAGYFVIVALLILASLLAGVLIFLPLLIRKRRRDLRFTPTGNISYPSFYFALIGFGFMLVEIPLIQRFILYVGNPAYAIAVVLFTLLLFSGIGSARANRVPHRLAVGLLIIYLLGLHLLLPLLFNLTLGMPFFTRLALTVIVLAPMGFLMGIPFPAGIHWLMEIIPLKMVEMPGEIDTRSGDIPLIWAVNGVGSVIASILAALVALSLGFGWVERIGALCYAGAWLVIMAPVRRVDARSLRR
jgi:hypothetical protein